MNDSLWELGIIVFLVLVNGAFSMSEIAIVSARKSRLQQLANEGSHRAAVALELANSPRRFLATVQVVLTLVSTLAAAYSGANLADKLSEPLSVVPGLQYYHDGIALFLVVLFVTILQVVLGELAPKAIALNQSENMALRVAIPMRWFSKVLTPFVVVLDRATGVLLRVIGSKAETDTGVTGEEIGVMVAQGTEAGVFEVAQQDMMESVIEMHERRISTLMTPRPDIVWLEVDATHSELLGLLTEHPHSRFPVCRGGLDQILGVVHMKDLLADFLENKPMDLAVRAQKPLTIPETISITKALESMRTAATHMAFVIDEYGSLQGIVTLKDILESIVGDLPSPDGDQEPEVVQREDGSWLADGTTGIDDIKELLQVNQLDGEEENTYQSLGGFVMTQLGRIPKVSDHFQVDGFRYEVMDMDGNRVDKVLISREETPAQAAATALLHVSPNDDD
jgi:putative hemolysin